MAECRRNSIILISSAIIIALIFTFPTGQLSNVFSWMIYRIGSFANTLFHELGHAIFGWLYGIPMIPAILTVFGSDQAGGVAVSLYERTWFLQIIALGGLAWATYFLRKVDSYYFFPVATLFGFIFITSFTGYHGEIISYMGHGGSILAGGFLLFKAVGNINMRHAIERWMNAFFGTFLLFNNLFFSWGLLYHAESRIHYVTHQAFGSGHNDFVKIITSIDGLTLNMVAGFTMILSITSAALAFFFVYYINREMVVKKKDNDNPSPSSDW